MRASSSTAANANDNGALALLEQQATTLGAARGVGAAAISSAASAASVMPALELLAGQRAVESPTGGSVVELRVQEGAHVAAGDPLLVVSAMKMETVVAAPCSGLISAVQPLNAGDAVAAGQLVAVAP